MDQEKIGKFISTCRKNKKLTQSELAEMLMVTDRSVSNWENGKNMPDLSLFKPLCKILGITINELLSGEKLSKQDYQEKLEENIVNTIDYSTNKMNKYNQIISFILIIFGLFISISAIMIFKSESSWSSIYSLFGIVVFTIGINRLLNKMVWHKRLLLVALVFIFTVSLLFFTDYINVKNNEEAPMFRIKTITTGDVIYYDTPFYDVYRCNFDKQNEYWVISKNAKPSTNDLIDYCK